MRSDNEMKLSLLRMFSEVHQCDGDILGSCARFAINLLGEEGQLPNFTEEGESEMLRAYPKWTEKELN